MGDEASKLRNWFSDNQARGPHRRAGRKGAHTSACAAGQGGITLFLEDIVLQTKIAFSNKFFTFFFAVWLVSFLIPNDVYKQLVQDFQSKF